MAATHHGETAGNGDFGFKISPTVRGPVTRKILSAVAPGAMRAKSRQRFGVRQSKAGAGPVRTFLLALLSTGIACAQGTPAPAPPLR